MSTFDVGRTSWGQIALDWRGVFEIADAHPDLPIILLREGGSTERILFEVWDQFPNLHLETGYMQASGIIDDDAKQAILYDNAARIFRAE